MIALSAGPAAALSVSTVTKADTDSLMLQFSRRGSYPSITRSGPAEISLTFPPGSLAGEAPPGAADFQSSRLLEGVRLEGDTIYVRLKSDAFGFVGWPEGEQGLKLQVYRDPAGANWSPGAPAAEANTTWPPAEPAPKQASSLTLPVTPPNPKPGPLDLPPLPPSLAGAPQGQAPGQSPAQPPGQAKEAAKEPFYAVPSSMRATALQVGPDKAPVLRPDGMAATPSPALADKAAGGKEAGKGGGELRQPVKLPPIPPTLAGDATRAPVTPPAKAAAAPPAPAAAPAPAAPQASPQASPPATQTAADEPPPAKEEDIFANRLVAAQAERLAGNFFGANNMLRSLLLEPTLKPDVREEAMHTLAGVTVDLHKDDPAGNYDAIQKVLNEAINVNPNSYRVPEALLQLGMLNLRVGNIPEAKGYFNVLTRKYPTDANVPLVNFAWGEYYFDRGEYKKAEEEYKNVVEKFPESKFVREGAMGLAKTLVRLGRYKDAAQIADYIDKRWPRYYTEFPQILRITGDIAYKNGDFKKARDNYMLFYNMEPKVKDADLVLARLGDIYGRLGNKAGAVDFYNLAIKDYPDSEGGLVAKMRLAEQGVHDQPTITEMFSLFDKPQYGSPEEIYQSIIRDHPQSPLAPLAQLKLAMWLLHQQNYPGSLKAAAAYLERYPQSDLAPKAEETALTAFERMAADMLAHKDYDRLLAAYKEHRLINANRGMLSDTTRLGLALAYLRTGKPHEAIAEALPYVGPKETDNGNWALTMAMSVYQNERSWRDIVELARKVQDWRFSPSQRRGLEYLVAEALENLGESERALKLWTKMAGDRELEAEKRCYALYFVAREAMAKKEWEKAQLYATEAEFMFRETNRDPDKRKAAINIQVEAARALGEYPKALKYAEQYAGLCKEGDDDWAGNRMRMAAIQRAMGDVAGWRATLTAMRDAAPDSLYGRMAASDLAASGLQNRLDALTGSK
jgi:TolA-binding protein